MTETPPLGLPLSGGGTQQAIAPQPMKSEMFKRQFWRALGCAFVLAIMWIAFLSPRAAVAQEAAHTFFAADGAQIAPKAATGARKGRAARSDHIGGVIGMIASPSIVREASRYVGSTGPALGLPSRLWCADFANMILRKTGHRTVASRRAIDMRHAGQRIARPVPGALMITGRRGGGHVSIVASVEGRTVTTINGNGRFRRVSVSARPAHGVFVLPSPS